MHHSSQYFSSKLDVWMVFCVIFVFSTLLEFAILIFVQKQIFDRKIKKAVDELCRERLLSRSASRFSGNRVSIKSSNKISPTSINGNDDGNQGNADPEYSTSLSTDNGMVEIRSRDEIIENGIMGSETNQSDKNMPPRDTRSKWKNVSSQTSSNFVILS